MSTPNHRRPLFNRSSDKRVLTGVAGGMASILGVEPWIARLGLMLMTFAGGAGIFVYAFGYLLSSPRLVARSPISSLAGESLVARSPSSAAFLSPRPVTSKHTAGTLCISFAVLFGAQSLGFGVPPATLPPLMLLVTGLVIAWALMDAEDRALLRKDPISILQGKGNSTWRFLVGGAILVSGIVLLLANSRSLASSRPVLIAIAATIIGLSLVLGPSLISLARQVTKEQRERIRTEERADMSAHLHDSVLNTLALIQRSEALPDVVALARRQERELRAWMQGRLVSESDRLDDAVDTMVSTVEAHYNVTVDAVVVGGAVRLDDRVNTFMSAIQEAVINAALHSAVSNISTYIEVEPEQLTGFVRDQGKGFDRKDVGEDRRGIADSIEGRIRRSGGNATIRSVKGEGTEVELHLPRDAR